MYQKQKSACYWLDHEQISDTSNNKFSFLLYKNDEPLILYDHFFNANEQENQQTVELLQELK